MGQIIGCVTHVVHKVWVMKILLTKLIFKAYYRATVLLPRRIPTTIQEFMSLKEILTTYYGLEDRPVVWFTVASQMTAGKPTSIRRAYVYYVNVAKRLPTNSLVKDVKLYFDDLNEKLLKEVMEKQAVASQSTEPRESNE